jgi:pyrrolysine biosynthesis protein PylC
MLMVVVGGKLQGIEACYLGRKADWEVVLVDRCRQVPARGLCNAFIAADVLRDKDLGPIFQKADFVLPALENTAALDALVRRAQKEDFPLAFDPGAYAISSSKRRSDRLFAELGLPTPQPWPDGRFPLIVKPSAGSGSRGVRLIQDGDGLRSFFSGFAPPPDVVVQEFLAGPSFSLEVIGRPGGYETFQVTEIFADSVYDCKRVLAPVELGQELVNEFENLTDSIAQAVELRGIMDVEVILHEGRLKVLEIDARLPSQTPTAVYWSTGWNFIQILYELMRSEGPVQKTVPSHHQAVVYEHIHATPGCLAVAGEHVMAAAGELRLYKDFFGADEAISDYVPGCPEWRATLIITGADRRETMERRCQVVEAIRKRFDLHMFIDDNPLV